MRLVLLVVFLLGCSLSAMAQTQVAQPVGIAQPGSTTLRIEQGKVWINGKQVPSDQLPIALQRVDKGIYYETKISGVSEFTFNLGDDYFLVQGSKISPFQMPEEEVAADTKSATEAYYSQLKRESPGLFYGLSREGILLEEIRGLLYEYSVAKSKDRSAIKAQLRKAMEQLYDINERNKELEIEELEQMIDAAKEEISYRKAHKQEIIDNSLENLLRAK